MSKADEKGRARAEKLSLLSSMLGPEAMARVKAGHASQNDPDHIDPERIAWHRNRLLERLRAQKPPQTTPESPQPKKAHNIDARLNALVDLGAISEEHPAVIVRIMEGMERSDRAALLKELPGPLARRLLHRMRRA